MEGKGRRWGEKELREKNAAECGNGKRIKRWKELWEELGDERSWGGGGERDKNSDVSCTCTNSYCNCNHYIDLLLKVKMEKAINGTENLKSTWNKIDFEFFSEFFCKKCLHIHVGLFNVFLNINILKDTVTMYLGPCGSTNIKQWNWEPKRDG